MEMIKSMQQQMAEHSAKTKHTHEKKKTQNVYKFNGKHSIILSLIISFSQGLFDR